MARKIAEVRTLQVFNFRNLYGSGLTESVPSLCRGLVNADVEVDACAPRARPEWMSESFKMHVYPTIPGFAWLGWSPRMQLATVDIAKECGLVHCHEMWTLPGRYASLAARKAGIPCVISPRGTLSAAARAFSGWKKRLMWRWRKPDVMLADCMHATAEHEREDIRSTGYRGPIALVPNAVPAPEGEPPQQKPQLRRLVYLARIHPIKGVVTLVDLWRNLSTEYPDWELEIAGVDDGGHVAELKALAAKLKLERIKFSGPQFGEDKSRFLFSADLYCLPTTSDNFAITVGEALAHGVPAVTTTAAPWADLVVRRCGWWEEPNSEAVGRALREAMGKSRDDLATMGKRGRRWIADEFGADSVGRRMREVYEWLIGGGTAPSYVETGTG